MRHLISAALLAASTVAAQTERSNILVLVADDLGADALACYTGNAARGQLARTPNIDHLAATGVRFQNAWAYALCSPTRAALHTGRYGFRTGVGHLAMGRRGALSLGPEEVTLPRLLDRAHSGYAHALFGKWHLGDGDSGRGPNQTGWSHFAGLLPGGLFRRNHYYGWPRTVDGRTERCTEYTTTRITGDALAWIRSQETPWLAVVNFIVPHSPYQEPPAHLHHQDPAADLESDPRTCFRAMVEAMDTAIGRLLAALGDARKQTVVIFLGDNGTAGALTRGRGRGRGRRGKGTPYETGIRVPLIISGPAVRKPGRRVDHLVSVVDLYATIAELAGVDARAVVPEAIPLDAVSMVPYLRDPDQAARRTTMISELFTGRPDQSGFVAIRDERYKLIRSFRRRRGARARDELYDLASDPGEEHDLLRGEQDSTTAAAFRRLDRALAKLNRGAARRGR